METGAQLYTLRAFCGTPDDLARSLERVAEIGYRTVQVSGTCPWEAEWLKAQGVDPSRLIVEDHSLTTAQNAVFTFDLLAEKAPRVKQIAVISSDYHIATGTLLFGAEAILRDSDIAVVGNAAWPAPSGSLSAMFQAGALIELSGDVETAFEIYYETYDIHELPPLHE